MDYSEIGRHARVRRAIIDKNVYVPRATRSATILSATVSASTSLIPAWS